MPKKIMRNWKKKFENKFIADDILDCIPLANWEEMGDEVFAFIEEEKRKSFEAGEEDSFNRGYEAGFEDGEDKGFKEGYKMATDDTGWKGTSGITDKPHNNFMRGSDDRKA